MNDIELFVIGSGIVYAIGKALEHEPKQHETIRYTKTKQTAIASKIAVPPARFTRLTSHRYPVRVPVDTTLQPPVEPRKQALEPQQDTVQPSKRKARAHRGTGPFGFTQDELKAARKYLSVGGDPVEYDEAVSNNGWLVGLSESEGE